MDRKAQKSLERLRPRIEPRLVGVDPQAREIFWQRVEKIFPEAFALLLELYGTHYAFFYHLEEILKTVAQAYCDRSPDLHTLDRQREPDPLWFHSEKMVGGVCYVDLFAGTLAGVQEKIAYFKELGRFPGGSVRTGQAESGQGTSEKIPDNLHLRPALFEPRYARHWCD